MCYAVQCPKCKKTTWSGCGMHIQQVIGHLPTSQVCQCKRKSMQT